MKKNKNILEYLEAYKEKNHLVYTDEKSKLYKYTGILFIVSCIYSLIIMFALIFGWSYGLYRDYEFNKPNVPMLIVTSVIAVVMISSMLLFKFKLKNLASIAVIIAQITFVFTYKATALDGLNYRASFYWAFIIPAALISLLALVLLGVSLYSKYRTNKLYTEIIFILYKQYGKKDGVKLSDAEWEEFLDNYKPGKK